jgi:hypothetical protein
VSVASPPEHRSSTAVPQLRLTVTGGPGSMFDHVGFMVDKVELWKVSLHTSGFFANFHSPYSPVTENGVTFSRQPKQGNSYCRRHCSGEQDLGAP